MERLGWEASEARLDAERVQRERLRAEAGVAAAETAADVATSAVTEEERYLHARELERARAEAERTRAALEQLREAHRAEGARRGARTFDSLP